MQDRLLLIALGITFLAGFFMMKKLDSFLESVDRANSLHPQDKENSLRIGFSDPMLADSITGILDAFTRSQGNISIYLLSGNEGELLRGLSRNELDVAFLPDNIVVPKKTHYNMGWISMAYIPVRTKYGGLEIESITERHLLQTVLWEDTEKTSIVSDFIRCLKKGTDWRNKDGTAKAET